MGIHSEVKQITEMADLRTEEGGSKRLYLKISNTDFKTAFLGAAEKHVQKNPSDNNEFIVNDQNREVINQIYYYLKGSNLFDGNPRKGLLLAGGYGTGKTTIIKTIVSMIEYYSNIRFSFVPCVEMASEIKEKGLKFYERRPIVLDEIGRESKVIKDYGTEIRPIQEMLAMRYNSQAWTFGTTNFNKESLAEFYGGYIEDRLKEMFNIIEVTGESFRE